MLSLARRNLQRATSHSLARTCGIGSVAPSIEEKPHLPAERHGHFHYNGCILHQDGNFEPKSDGSEAAEQFRVSGERLGCRYNCAVKMQNPARAKSMRFFKMLGIKPKNSEKKDSFFWPIQPDNLLKTHNIIKFLRRTNPSEPEPLLKAKEIEIAHPGEPERVVATCAFQDRGLCCSGDIPIAPARRDR